MERNNKHYRGLASIVNQKEDKMKAGLLIHVNDKRWNNIVVDQRFLSFYAEPDTLDKIIKRLGRGMAVSQVSNPKIPEAVWRGVLNPFYDSYKNWEHDHGPSGSLEFRVVQVVVRELYWSILRQCERQNFAGARVFL